MNHIAVWRRIRGARAGLTLDGLLAVLTWLVLTPLGVLLVRAWDLDPFSVRGVVMPMGVGAVAAAVVLAAFLRTWSDKLIGVAMGLYAAWIGLVMAAALHGTPFGYGSMAGDAGRFVAMAMKYMTSWASTDSFVKGMPTEYPPLYPWLVGHIAAAVDRPAWQIFGEVQIVVMSSALVVAYVFWRRLVGAGVAFAIVGLAPAIFSQPSKDYEFFALLVFTPWVLATFIRLPRAKGGLSWWAAGIVGGLLVLTYQAWLLYSALGLLAIMGLTLRAAPDRARYLLHLLGVAVVAFLVASWYVVPFLSGLVTDGGSRLSDFWMSGSITDRPLVLSFLDVTPIAAVELIGLLGLIWYRRTTWWATPMLMLVLGNYAYRIAFLVKTAQDNHTGYLQYTETLIAMVLMTAGVLTVSEAAPGLWWRWVHSGIGTGVGSGVGTGVGAGVESEVGAGVGAREGAGQVALARVRPVVVTGVVVLVLWSAVHGWNDWVPGPRGLRDSAKPSGIVNRGTDAHAELLPDGTTTRFAPPKQYLHTRLRTAEIEKLVTGRLGTGARPVVLSYDQRLFAFTDYYGYISTDRVSSNTLMRWDERAAELRRLAAITDPTAFAAATRKTAFGPIDVFVLHNSGSRYRWRDIYFSSKAFDPASFAVTKLPGGVVVAIRKP